MIFEYPVNTINETQRSPLVKLRGLLPEARYRIEGIKDIYSGKYLMEVGIEFPVRGAYKSRIFTVTAVD